MSDNSRNQHAAQADGDPMEFEMAGSDWYLRGREDAAQGRNDPPSDPNDRLTYDAGRNSLKDITP